MGRIFCWFSIHNWIGDHCSMGMPMRSHVCFGSTFVSDLIFKITWSISSSLICTINLISLPVRNACFPSFWTTRGSPDPTHLVISSYSPFTALLSHNSFMHVSKKVVSIEGSIPSSSWSLLPKVEASVKLFSASMNVSFTRSKSNSGSFVGALLTHKFSYDCFPLASPVVTSLPSIMFTFGSSSRGSYLIIYKFWVGGGWSTPFSHSLTISVGHSSASLWNLVQYKHGFLVGFVWSQA